MDQIQNALVAWTVDALMVVGPLLTLAIVAWARTLIAKASARSAVAEVELKAAATPMSNEEKHALADSLMQDVPLPFRPTAAKRQTLITLNAKRTPIEPPPAGEEP